MKKVLLLLMFGLAITINARAQGIKSMKTIPPDILSSASVLVLQLPDAVFSDHVQQIKNDLNKHGLQIIDHYNVSKNPTIQKKNDEVKAKELEGKNVKYQLSITFFEYDMEAAALNPYKKDESVLIMVVPVTADLKPAGSYYRLDAKTYAQGMEKLGKELSKLEK
ncbi:hypothetical protein H8S95_03955 [Pontibacter sp. KCTC 32443]|uniref:hypothetical protein n=1 Tax=Pontibacter TaxID=323449 RepID=UPI00164D15BE|nr:MULTISPECIES: hypothetical protein [Pontibacter]MBC5773207.1 hypothetical protein [Pontibacter sp. KCTC 32443]